MHWLSILFAPFSVFLMAGPAYAGQTQLPATGWIGGLVLTLFVAAYAFVLLEEKINLRKSKPVTIAAGLIWIFVMFGFAQEGRTDDGVSLLRHALLEYAELMLFLLSAMTYVNTMEERGLFQALQVKLVSKGFSLRRLYWICGTLAFFMSPVADNLTTALVLAAVALAVGQGHKKFIVLSCINIVVAANAGGAFSPFGDITTLMVWQKGVVAFWDFFNLFVPSLISWLIPAALMGYGLPAAKPDAAKQRVQLKKGAFVIACMFVLTIAATVMLHQTLHIPPFLGMMTGLGALKLYGYLLRRNDIRTAKQKKGAAENEQPFDIFVSLRHIEWDTMMFFYGVMMCVGGLGAVGHLQRLANWLYSSLSDTTAHVIVGLLSAIIDNIPVMFAVLSMDVPHNQTQWLLVTLTAGIGGSLLSIGSAAGVALMGQAKGTYTFSSHLKWSWAILLGYIAGIASHLALNG